jgi:hypothetical protein
MNHTRHPKEVLLPDWARQEKQSAFEMRWHTRRNQIPSFGETDESI